MSTPLHTEIGIGFKARWFEALRDNPANIPLGFLEVHAENYMVAGGPKRAMLDQLNEHYALSCHGVGLSIGAPADLDPEHLKALRELQDRYKPRLYSEHLAWSSHGLNHYSDLLPLPYNHATLETVCRHVSLLQDALGRQVLIENPSSYLGFEASTFEEGDFLDAMVQRTGCALLLDINNVEVSAHNLNFSARVYLERFPLEHVGEIHLAGYEVQTTGDSHELLIDSHDSPVAANVFELYAEVLRNTGAVPTLIERDSNLPPLEEMLDEAQHAAALMAAHAKRAA